MLWLRKFHPPRRTPQVCATMKLVFYLPQYQIHRLYQLESLGDLSSISSLRHYRKRVGQYTTLFDSMKDTNAIIKSMIANDDPISTITQSSITPTSRISRRLQHPPAIREKGVTDITNWHAPTTGFTPQRNMSKFYHNASASSSYTIVDRKRNCPGNPILLVDEKGNKKKKMMCMRCGGRSLLVYCTVCHHNYCFDVNTKKSDSTHNITDKFGAIDTKKRDKDNKTIYKYGIIFCFHHEHPFSFPVYEDENDTRDLPSVTPASNRL